MSLCGYARVLRGQSPLPRCPRHGRGPFTPCHPRRSFNYSSLPLDASVYRADNYNHSRGPRSLRPDSLLYRRCRFSLSVFSFLFPPRIFVFFLSFFFFTILKSRTCIFFRSFEYFEFSELFICLDQFPNISTVCRFK